MPFEWEPFLDRRNIAYQTRGGVTTRGNIAIHCPMCGSGDRSYHLSISTRGRGWYCWLDKRHRGSQPHRLIQALLGCSYLEAEAIVKGENAAPGDDEFRATIEALAGQPAAPATLAKTDLALPPEFMEIRDRGMRRQFAGYLYERGFAEPERVADEHGLLCATEGRYAGRVIFPIHMDGDLVCWTGRHAGASRLRYLTLSTGDDPPARLAIKRTLLWYDRLKTAPAEATLIVTEGPFDALKVSYLGRDRGIYATCLYGKNISLEQADLVASLDFAKMIYVFDPDFIGEAMDFLYTPHSNVQFRFLDGVKDPGDFDKASFDRFLRTL